LLNATPNSMIIIKSKTSRIVLQIQIYLGFWNLNSGFFLSFPFWDTHWHTVLFLDFVKSSNVNALDKVLIVLDLFGELIDGNLVVFNDAGNLQLLNSISERY